MGQNDKFVGKALQNGLPVLIRISAFCIYNIVPHDPGRPLSRPPT